MNYSNSVDQFIIPRNKNLHIGVFLFVIILSVLTSCEKDEIDKLPAETKSGRNTFGCLINGKAFRPNKFDFHYEYSGGTLIPDDYFEIRAFNDEIVFRILIFDSSLGINDSLSIHYEGAIEIGSNMSICGEKLFINPNDDNFVDISYWDDEKQIVAGTFDLTFYSENCEEEIIRVTDGRFDIKYTY